MTSLTPVTSTGAPRLLTPADLCEQFPGTTAQTWAQRRYMGTGPDFAKIGRRVYYRQADVDAWSESQIRTRSDRDAAVG
ncbi:helix-turn-helix transcriptional regulator [Corynebacterium sp. AOP12-C2-36]|uniref:helix-turn-helix transcriptional regulator n=1 Tax=Corynebacterium sp. AOP12-C2-36 TaxID=3457723 RepID=UPI004033D283